MKWLESRGLRHRQELAGLVSETEFVAIDLEMTGLSPGRDSIVAMGAVRMIGGRILCGESFYTLVKPRTPLRSEGIRINEIMPSEVANQPDIETALTLFLEFCGKRVIVGYCTAIDLSFLNAELVILRQRRIENPCLDVAHLHRSIRTRCRSAPLDRLPLDTDLYSIARALGVPVLATHHALADAFVTAQVFQQFLSILGGMEETVPPFRLTLDRLLRAGNPSPFWRRLQEGHSLNL